MNLSSDVNDPASYTAHLYELLLTASFIKLLLKKCFNPFFMINLFIDIFEFTLA